MFHQSADDDVPQPAAQAAWGRRILHHQGAAGLAMGVACLHLAWLERSLKLRGVATDAELVDLRVLDQSGEGPTYQVRYRFQTGLAGEAYSAHDLLRGKDAFLAVTKDGFDEARARGKVPVVYDSSNPWNNGPVRQPGWKGVTDSPWFFFLGGLPFLAVGAFLLLLGLGLLFLKRLPPLAPDTWRRVSSVGSHSTGI